MRGKSVKSTCNSEGVELYAAKSIIGKVHSVVLKSENYFHFGINQIKNGFRILVYVFYYPAKFNPLWGCALFCFFTPNFIRGYQWFNAFGVVIAFDKNPRTTFTLV